MEVGIVVKRMQGGDINISVMDLVHHLEVTSIDCKRSEMKYQLEIRRHLPGRQRR